MMVTLSTLGSEGRLPKASSQNRVSVSRSCGPMVRDFNVHFFEK